jgi:hypothetical protein
LEGVAACTVLIKIVIANYRVLGVSIGCDSYVEGSEKLERADCMGGWGEDWCHR